MIRLEGQPLNYGRSRLIDTNIANRAHGAPLKLAIAGALGTTLEFTTRDNRPEHAEMAGNDPFDLDPSWDRQ